MSNHEAYSGWRSKTPTYEPESDTMVPALRMTIQQGHASTYTPHEADSFVLQEPNMFMPPEYSMDMSGDFPIPYASNASWCGTTSQFDYRMPNDPNLLSLPMHDLTYMPSTINVQSQVQDHDSPSNATLAPDSSPALEDAVLLYATKERAHKSTKSSCHPRQAEILESSTERMQLLLVTEHAFLDNDKASRAVDEIFIEMRHKFTKIYPSIDWSWFEHKNAKDIVLNSRTEYRSQLKLKVQQAVADYFAKQTESAKKAELVRIMAMGNYPLTRRLDDQFYFWKPVIKTILRIWFGKTTSLGHKYPQYFTKDGITLSNEPIAFVLTAVSFTVSL
ncbi:hypothetical protein BJ138DRAFT_1119884 [Hygrophoropsis aurantiaca]|uniref:Uncharacterized protein n=1 Tax=Hygrophoropsis aurantiaca TaxID=72124 RepID=A0ACB7ZTB8_9AGAM|nr:hypothetical protein BJ138DRAFT_1119884 [Hygrophoropsis aurantiaca]